MSAAAFGASAALPRVARAQNLPKIRVGTIASDSYGEPYYALDSGAFARGDVNIELTTFTNGGTILQACSGNSLDIGMGDAIEITNAVNAGLPFAIIAMSALYSSDAPATVLIVADDGKIKSAKDLNGKTIGVVSLRSLAEITTREWLTRNGADPSTVKFIETPQTLMTGAISRGAIAAAMLAEPHLSHFSAGMRHLGQPFDTCAKTFALTTFFARRDWLAANRGDVGRFIQSIYDTANWANGHRDQTATILSKYSQTDLTIVRSATRTRYATSTQAAYIDPVIAIAAKYHAVSKAIPASDLIFRV
jgi:NitT/TauT family transport system substrate-binding protein